MGGSGVNSQVQQQEQANQKQGEQYAAQQQEAAQKQLAAYIAANPTPVSQQGAIKPPSFQAPQTMGGGQFTGGQQTQQPAQPQPQPAQPQIPPQLRQALVALVGGQKVG